MNLGSVMPESDQQYGYGVLSYLTKIKHNAREDIDRACQAVSSRLPPSTTVAAPDMVTVKPRNPVSLTSRPELQLLLNNATAETVQALKGDVNEFHGFKVYIVGVIAIISAPLSGCIIRAVESSRSFGVVPQSVRHTP
jgi:hypothetical protein